MIEHIDVLVPPTEAEEVQQEITEEATDEVTEQLIDGLEAAGNNTEGLED